MTLIDMASVLDEMELPEEALAVLSGVKSTKRLPTPMGVPASATMADVRGIALLRLGRNSQAETAFKAALKASPGLSMTTMNLAVSQLCAGGNPTFPSGWFDPPPGSEPPENTNGTETQQAGSTFDTSGGVAGGAADDPVPD